MKSLRISDAVLGMSRRQLHQRRGAIIVLAAVMMVMVFGLIAFAVDLGYIAATKTELQTAADGAALAAAIEVADGLGAAPKKTQSQMQTTARAAAVAVAALNGNGERTSTFVDSNSHVRFGRITWNSSSNSWVKTWGATPANMVEVQTHRDSAGSGGNQKLGLFFGSMLGTGKASIAENAVAGVLPGVGFKIAAGSTAKCGALPITCDNTTWTTFIAQANIANCGPGSSSFSDNYSFNPTTGVCTSGSDGIRELNIYPDPNANLPAGNRGTCDLGNPNNSTADLSRQIRYGLNATDLSYFSNNTIRTDTGPCIVNGDTGISAGIKDDLEFIKGQPRLMPIFTVVGSQQQCQSGSSSSSNGNGNSGSNSSGSNSSGNGKGNSGSSGSSSSATGNNVYYRIEKFVGVRIVYVQLTGNNKQVLIQPATFTSSAVIRGKRADTGTGDTYYAKPGLLE